MDIILFRKKIKIITYFCPFLLFVYWLPSLTNEWLHTTLSALEDGAIEYILSAKIGLDGFDSVLLQVSVDFLFVFFSFCYLISFKYASNMTLWVCREDVKRDRCSKIYFFKECVMTLTSTPVFHKKK